METPPPSNTPTFDVGPQAPTPTLRRQESLEHILNFTILNSPPSSPSEVVEASFIYHQILADCEHDGPARIPPRHPRPVSINPTNPSNQRGQQAGGGAGSLPGIAEGGSDVLEDASSPSPNDDNDNDDEASTSPLVHELFAALYEHAPTVQGQANIVRLVLHALFGPSSPDNHTSALQRPLEVILPLARAWPTYTSEQKGGVYGALTILAVELLDCFFVPFLSQGNHTPAVRSSLISPTSRSEIDPTAQATYSRLQSLRHLCRSRDGNRCVITHQQGHVPTRGRRLPSRRQISSQPSVHLECAHIIPHSLNQAGAGGHLADDKTVLWRILNMFDPGVSLLLQGERIDGPANAMMLYPELHSRFGLLHWYLEEVPGGGGGDDDEAVYVFCRSRGAPLLPLHCMPAGPGGTVRFTRMDGSRTELPSRRLLAVHRACAKILEVAGAAEYVEDLLDEFEDVRGMAGLAGDGSSDLAMLVRVGVGLGEGWFHCEREREREGIAV